VRHSARSWILLLSLLAGARLAGAAESGDPGEPAPFPGPLSLRVETELFRDGADRPVARSLTLFDDGVAWDFLELPAADDGDEAAMQLVEIVLHDPARERVVVIDPVRRLKTEIP
jgi:hypothetical protein